MTNWTILQGIKVRLTQAKGSWAEDLYNILWTYWTTLQISIGETHFKLTFRTEAVIPLDIGHPTSWTTNFNQETNDDQLQANLDFLDKVWERASIRMMAYQHKAAKYYNSRINTKIFKVGDLVLRRAEVPQPTMTTKLSFKWEGPYQIIKII